MHKRSAWRFATPLACINFAIMNPIIVNDSDLRRAAAEGMDAFLDVFVNAYKAACGSELSAEAFGLLTPDQITLWGYAVLREEVMDGGFVQLIHNGYGPFFFQSVCQGFEAVGRGRLGASHPPRRQTVSPPSRCLDG